MTPEVKLPRNFDDWTPEEQAAFYAAVLVEKQYFYDQRLATWPPKSMAYVYPKGRPE